MASHGYPQLGCTHASQQTVHARRDGRQPVAIGSIDLPESATKEMKRDRVSMSMPPCRENSMRGGANKKAAHRDGGKSDGARPEPSSGLMGAPASQASAAARGRPSIPPARELSRLPRLEQSRRRQAHLLKNDKHQLVHHDSLGDDDAAAQAAAIFGADDAPEAKPELCRTLKEDIQDMAPCPQLEVDARAPFSTNAVCGVPVTPSTGDANPGRAGRLAGNITQRPPSQNHRLATPAQAPQGGPGQASVRLSRPHSRLPRLGGPRRHHAHVLQLDSHHIERYNGLEDEADAAARDAIFRCDDTPVVKHALCRTLQKDAEDLAPCPRLELDVPAQCSKDEAPMEPMAPHAGVVQSSRPGRPTDFLRLPKLRCDGKTSLLAPRPKSLPAGMPAPLAADRATAREHLPPSQAPAASEASNPTQPSMRTWFQRMRWLRARKEHITKSDAEML